jgi:hypothetical protein
MSTETTMKNTDPVLSEAYGGLMHRIYTDLQLRYLPAHLAKLRSEGKHQHVEALEKWAEPLRTVLPAGPVTTTDHDIVAGDDLERRLAKAEEQLAELMAHNELDRERVRQLVEHHLGRVPTDDDIERLARGEEVPRTRSVAAA